MTGWILRAKQAPRLRVDLRGVTPGALAALTLAQLEQLQIGYGKTPVPLAEFFHVTPGADDVLRFAADLARFDRIGWQMDGGQLIVEGNAGDYAGACMRGGDIRIEGSARDLVACEMAGGSLQVQGNVGDFAASTLPGSMDGMRGGCLVVKGSAGARFGDRMRRGTALVFGDVGDFLASRMVAGTIAIGGRCGAHPGFGMRRGSVVFANSGPPMPPTFVAGIAETPVFWQLLSRDLARHGDPFAELPSQRIERWLGDLAADGKGELISVQR